MDPLLVPSAIAGAYLGRYARRRYNKWKASRRRPNPYKMQRQITRLKRIAKGTELKTHDYSVTMNSNTTGLVEMMTAIAQGDTSLTREGLRIAPVRMYGKFIIYANDAQTNETETVRVMIIKDHMQTGTVPAINSDILESVDVLALKEHDSKPRYTILLDQIYNVTKEGSGNGISRRIVKINKKLKGKTYYTGTTAAQGNQGKNNYYFVTLSTDAGANPPYLEGNIRIRFYD